MNILVVIKKVVFKLKDIFKIETEIEISRHGNKFLINSFQSNFSRRKVRSREAHKVRRTSLIFFSRKLKTANNYVWHSNLDHSKLKIDHLQSRSGIGAQGRS